MKKLLIALALAGTASISTTAGAEPRPAAGPAKAYDWSGLYIGIQGGSGTSHTTVTSVTDTHFFTFIGDSRSITANGFLGGVILGAQKQFGLMILGIEAGSAWGTLSKTVRTQGRFTLDITTPRSSTLALSLEKLASHSIERSYMARAVGQPQACLLNRTNSRSSLISDIVRDAKMDMSSASALNMRGWPT